VVKRTLETSPIKPLSRLRLTIHVPLETTKKTIVPSSPPSCSPKCIKLKI
jgi:hypothetical protein